MATIREVAKKAGVSITTVSRILNNDDSFNVSKITKEKVDISLYFINLSISSKLRIFTFEKIFFNIFSKFIFKETK